MDWSRLSRSAILMTVTFFAFHSPGTAQLTQPAEVDRDGRASPWSWSLVGGYGRGVKITDTTSDVGDVRFVGPAARIVRPVGPRFFPDRWFEGDLHLHIEFPLWLSLEPRRGFATGATLLLQYLRAGHERLIPFAEIGAGPLYLAFDNDRSQSDGFSFTLQTGMGVRYHLTNDWALAVRANLHHISNAGLRTPNPGINNILFTVGIFRQR